MKVLIIDDSNTIRRSAEIFLKQGGHEVMLAEDGFDALAKISDFHPDLIFCDILMPRLDGYQTCAIIKRNEKFSTTPVIMLSSKDGVFDKARGRMVGSQEYLTKPFTNCCKPCGISLDKPIKENMMAIRNVLIVDDSKTELMFLSELLKKNGFSVTTAENAEDTYKRLAEAIPDLILMDVVMPGQNGFQLTRAITRDPKYANVPVIMCTSKNQETDRVWGMRQGARDYITKPVNQAELLAKIKALG